MKIVISTPHIIGKKTLSIKKYIIFSMETVSSFV